MEQNAVNTVYYSTFSTWGETVQSLLAEARLGELIAPYETVLIKPNLVSTDPPPITTPVQAVREIVHYISIHSPGTRIIVGEGTGTPEYNTFKPFDELGYRELASQYNIELMDLNTESLVELKNADCQRWPVMHLPEICLDSFIISVPVLKAHSIADVTLTMKNMIGIAPPEVYNAGSWNKSAFHDNVHEAIFDLNRYCVPDFTVLDATIGMSQAHLWGPECNPHVNMIAVSADPVAIDAFGAELLQIDWRDVRHIALADGVLGNSDAKRLFIE